MAKKKLIDDVIFESILAECELLEQQKLYSGNGLALARRLSTLALSSILPKQQKKIYAAITDELKTTKQVATEVKLPSSQVSAQLMQMSRTTRLVECVDTNHRRSWRRRPFPKQLALSLQS